MRMLLYGVVRGWPVRYWTLARISAPCFFRYCSRVSSRRIVVLLMVAVGIWLRFGVQALYSALTTWVVQIRKLARQFSLEEPFFIRGRSYSALWQELCCFIQINHKAVRRVTARELSDYITRNTEPFRVSSCDVQLALLMSEPKGVDLRSYGT